MSRSARTSRCSASAVEKPRSRKTFPVDGVTLTALFFAMLLPQCRDGAIPLAANFQIPGRRLLRLLLERVEDVDRLCARRHVEHPVRALDVDPDLTNARSDGRHRLPVVRVQSVLDTPELEPGQPACQRRE